MVCCCFKGLVNEKERKEKKSERRKEKKNKKENLGVSFSYDIQFSVECS